MKVLSGAVVLFIALAGSACGSGHSATQPTTTAKKAVVSAEAAALAKLPPAVRKAVEGDLRAGQHPSKSSTVNAIEVYGPDTRTALNAASGGGVVVTPTERKNYYLTVLYGQFDCVSCSRPCCNVPDPRGTIEWSVWSPTAEEGDGGLRSKLPRAVSRLHRLIRIRLR